MDTTFDTWNVRYLYMADLLMTIVKELSKCNVDLVGVQDVRSDSHGTDAADIHITFF
jgi:hypothetical protein